MANSRPSDKPQSNKALNRESQHFQKMWTVLGVCLERCRNASNALIDQEWDEFDRWMRMRNAAFSNFRILEHRLFLSENFWQDSRTVALVNDILSADVSLERDIKLYQQDVEWLLRESRRDRMGIAKFHSGQKKDPRFFKAV